jgi:hypothetical protein
MHEEQRSMYEYDDRRDNEETQENRMQQIPGGTVQMITDAAFCRFKASGKVKRAMAQFNEKAQKDGAARKRYTSWYYCWENHITGEQVMDSYYLRIKDLDKICFCSREYVNTAVNRVIPGGNPDDLKYKPGYIYRNEIEALADESGVIYLFSKCVGRIRGIHWQKERYDIVIRNGTDAIADSALADNYLIVSVTLPDSVTVIGTGALERSRLLGRVRLSPNLKYIKDAAFRFCWKLQRIDLPDGLLYIGADAFRRCTAFTELMIPDSVTYIGSKAFFGCINLKAVRLPAHITAISTGMFRHCHQLPEIVIPEAVTVIEQYAFANCSYLEHVSLPSGLKRIGDGAFADCRMLRFLEIPDSVEYIGEDLFGGRREYTTIVASEGNTYARRYAASHQIHVTDRYTDEMYRALVKRAAYPGNP